MTVVFEYDRGKDIWCLLNKGQSSNNSQQATRVYQELVQKYGADPTHGSAEAFIESHLAGHGTDMKKKACEYQQEWDAVSEEYEKRARKIFGVFLPRDVTGYLTVNNRCPYNIEESHFFVAVPTASVRKTTMHELWHFYTWQKFAADQEERLGKQNYNDIKEAFTVLLNVECRDLLPEGVTDVGYPQHKVLREEILRIWTETKDIKKLWDRAVEHQSTERAM